MSRACLLLHGFTGGPHEVMPLADHLRAKGWDCFVPTLPGHEGPLHGLRSVGRRDWIETASQWAERITKQYGSFDLVGFSMGGLIAAYVANRFPVRRLALLNTAVYYISPGRFVRHAVNVLRSGDFSSLRLKYGTPFRAIAQFAMLAKELRCEFSELKVPTFIAHGDLDEVVHPRSAAYIEKKMKGEKVVSIFPQSRHLICLGPESEQLFAEVERFFR